MSTLVAATTRDVLVPTIPDSPPMSNETQGLRLSDGRTLAWQGYGDPQGVPLYVFHGFPSCRLLASLIDEQAAARGICLIAPDRPGFGRSTPLAGRRIEDWPGDVAALADNLGHRRFGVLGISCGGPYALACAHQLPERVYWAGALGGIGPMHLPAIRARQLPPLKLLFGLARRASWLASPLLWLDAWLFRRHPARALASVKSLLTAPDRTLLDTDAVVRGHFCASLVEAYRQGIAGALLEARLIARYRGEALAEIHTPVHLYQGGQDRHVPPEMARHIARMLPNSHLHVYPDEGHLSVVTHCFDKCAVHFLAAR